VVWYLREMTINDFQVTTVDDALAVLEENGDPLPLENSSGGRGTASLERGLSLTTKGGHAIHMSQKGKKDTLYFTLGVSAQHSNTNGMLPPTLCHVTDVSMVWFLPPGVM